TSLTRNCWELVSTPDPKYGLGLQNTGSGDPQVVVLVEGGTNKFLQSRILENRPPLLVGQGGRILLVRIDNGASIYIGYGRWRSLIPRANSAAGDARNNKDDISRVPKSGRH